MRDRWAALMGAGLALASACVSGPIPAAGHAALEPISPAEIWVDAYAPEGGSGAADLPFRSVPQELPAGSTVHFRTGLYRGPFRVPLKGTFEGPPSAVLFLDDADAGTVVTIENGTLRQLSVQGGLLGLKTEQLAIVEGVHFSGHRTAAIEVTSAELRISGAEFRGVIPESRGIVVVDAGVRADGLRFTGQLKRAIESINGTLMLSNLTVEGPSTALHARGSKTTIDTLTAQGGTGPAFFLLGGTTTLTHGTVLGHEYGVEAKDEKLTVNHLSVKGSQLSAVSLMRCTATLNALSVERGGSLAGVVSMESALTMPGATLVDNFSVGLLIRLGSAVLGRLDVRGVTAEKERDGSLNLGDALHVRNAKVQLEMLNSTDAQGSALFAGAQADVTATQVNATQSGFASVVSERGSTVRIEALTSTASAGAPAILVPDAATMEIGALKTQGTMQAWAECQSGAVIRIRDARLAHGLPELRCITLGAQ